MNRFGYRRGGLYWTLRKHMEAWPGFSGAHPFMWDNWQDGVYQSYRDLAGETVRADSVGLHAYAQHVLSSQAFAFNLFLPFRDSNRERLSRRVSSLIEDDLTIDRVAFEWVPPGHLLGEIAGERPGPEEPATAVDVVLSGRLQDGHRAAVLVEVKLTEAEFSHCKGRKSPNNRREDVCQSARPFFDNPQDCYLRRPDGTERDRRYWEIFTRSRGSLLNTFPNACLIGECPFAYDMQQPMRNLAIAQGLEQEGMVEKAWYILCAHDHNREMIGHWQAWQRLLAGSTPAPFLPASDVINAGEEDGLEEWGKYMRGRYRL